MPPLLIVFKITIFFIFFLSCEPVSQKRSGSPLTNLAFILTSNFQEGSYSTIDLIDFKAYNDLGQQQVHSDALVKRSPYDDRIYIINRQGRDNIQIINPYLNFQTEKEISVGTNSNPRDLAFLSSSKAYVTRYNESSLWLINLISGDKIGEINLASWANEANTGQNKNIPQMNTLYLDENGYLFIALQRLQDSWHPSSYSSILVFKTADNSFQKEIKLEWLEEGQVIRATNPYSELKFVSKDLWQPEIEDGHDHLLVACPGEFGNFQKLDGGIIALDLEDQECEAGYLVTEEEIKMEVVTFEVKSLTSIYILTSLLENNKFISKLINFNPKLKTFSILAENLDNQGQLVDFKIHSSGLLFLCDQKITLPGIRIYDTNGEDRSLHNDEPVYVGLPPRTLIFYE